ncbi:MAG: methylmalonyl Co-A mutase-associated GTPase MeaB [Acidimicrobiia bacterium]|nr:methylmalonyl Co-A mutase-associated GTPase MeaB [Acidimicrobiia bacterium]
MTLSSDPSELLDAARSGSRAALARLLSLAESDREAEVVKAVHPLSGQAHVVGFTGAPGAGKSTLVDRVIAHLRTQGTEVGVLAVDPSSPFSGGAILGDRVRMQEHALDPGVFIRSMASRGALGGLSLAAPSAIRVLDAAGKPYVLVETVGVGQVEVEIVETADTVVVVVNPGWGDAIQAAKAGLMEIADVFVVNKADRPGADEAVMDLESMLDMAPPTDWIPPVRRCVASTGEGVEDVWAAVEMHRDWLAETGRRDARRRAHLADEIRKIVVARIDTGVRGRCRGAEFDALVAAVLARELDPHSAAERILTGIES